MDAIVGPRTPRAIAGCKNRMAPSTDRRSNCPKRPRVGASDAGPYPRAGDYQCVFGWLALLEVAGNRLGVDAAGRNLYPVPLPLSENFVPYRIPAGPWPLYALLAIVVFWLVAPLFTEG